MHGTVNKVQLDQLVRNIDDLAPVWPAGYMRRQIETTGFLQEQGLRFVESDFVVGQYYAGLAVLARDMHQYLAQRPRDDAVAFKEVVSLVHAEDSRTYGAGAFPTYQGLPADTLPKGIAAAAADGHVDIGPLKDPGIVHEWTFKPGKRLFVKFGTKFKETICGKDSPYEQFTNGLVGQAALPSSRHGTHCRFLARHVLVSTRCVCEHPAREDWSEDLL